MGEEVVAGVATNVANGKSPFNEGILREIVLLLPHQQLVRTTLTWVPTTDMLLCTIRSEPARRWKRHAGPDPVPSVERARLMSTLPNFSHSRIPWLTWALLVFAIVVTMTLTGCIVVTPPSEPPEPAVFVLSVPGSFEKYHGRTWVKCESRVTANDHCEFGL
jgi:hypothetical protein